MLTVVAQLFFVHTYNLFKRKRREDTDYIRERKSLSIETLFFFLETGSLVLNRDQPAFWLGLKVSTTRPT